MEDFLSSSVGKVSKVLFNWCFITATLSLIFSREVSGHKNCHNACITGVSMHAKLVKKGRSRCVRNGNDKVLAFKGFSTYSKRVF